MEKTKRSIEERLQAVEDRLEILNLVGGHPPGVAGVRLTPDVQVKMQVFVGHGVLQIV